MTVNSLDVRGVYTVIPGGDASQPGRASTSASNLMLLMEKNAMAADSDVMAELADSTGGQFFHNDNGLFEGFRQLVAQPEYIYILGFSPQNLKLDGARHGLKVALKNPKGFEWQARSAYYAPNHAVNSEEQAKEEIQEAVFSRDEIQELPVDLNLQYARAGDTAVKLNVLAKINLKLLRFRKVEDRNLDTLMWSPACSTEWKLRRRNSEDRRLAPARPDARLPQLRHHRQDYSQHHAGKLPGAVVSGIPKGKPYRPATAWWRFRFSSKVLFEGGAVNIRRIPRFATVLCLAGATLPAQSPKPMRPPIPETSSERKPSWFWWMRSSRTRKETTFAISQPRISGSGKTKRNRW